MLGFSLIAGLLLMVALVFVVPTLWNSSRGTAWLVAGWIVLGSIGLYAFLGSTRALSPEARMGAAPRTVTQQDIEAMVTGLAQRMKSQPENQEGWSMLARSYAMLGRFSEAEQAYAHLVARHKNDAQLLADYADAYGMAHGKILRGKPEILLHQALKIDPKNIKALLLMGSAQFEQSDYHQAIASWKKIAEQVPPESELGKAVAGNIQEAEKKL